MVQSFFSLLPSFFLSLLSPSSFNSSPLDRIQSSRRYTSVRFSDCCPWLLLSLLRKKRVHRVGRCRLLKRLRDIGWRRMPVTLSRRFLTSVVIKNSLATCTPAASEKIEIEGRGGDGIQRAVRNCGINRVIPWYPVSL